MASPASVFAVELHDADRYATIHKIGCRDLVDPEEIPFGEDPHQYLWPEGDPAPQSMYMPCTRGLVNEVADLHSLAGLKVQAVNTAKSVRRLSRSGSWDDAVQTAQMIASGIAGEHVTTSSIIATTVDNVSHLYSDSSVIHTNRYLEVTLFHAETSDDKDWLALAKSKIDYQLNPDMFASRPVGLTMILSKSGRTLTLMYINKERDYCYIGLPNKSEDLLLDLFNSTNMQTSESMEQALSEFFASLL